MNDKIHRRPKTIGISLIPCLLALLGQVGDSAAQAPVGHRFEGEKIVVDLPDHWRNWTGPTHVVDVEEDGTFKPHFFRRVFDIVAEDRGIYGKPLEEPGIRKADVAIMNLERTFALEDDGSVKVGKKTEQLIKFLNRDFLRFPGNESHIRIDGRLFAIVDTAMSADGKEITLNLRNQRTGVATQRDFGAKDKFDFPVYEYVQRVGVSRVGSNEELAGHIVDGNMETYWEPDLDADSDKWWIEVDLGRTVVVEKVVLHFVDEELGDPFRQFRVMLAPQQKVIQSQSRVLQFRVVGRTRAPNTDQRTMAFSSEETLGFAESDGGKTEWTGRMAQTLRILVGDSKLRRAREVGEEQWNALDPADRGDILYFIRDTAGFEEPVDQAIYEDLPVEQQGRKEYYIRERPRLAEVEVWGWGDNLSPSMIDGGGSVAFTGPEVAAGGFDADWNTSFRMTAWFDSNPQGNILTVDVGARVWLDAMRLAVNSIPGYIVEVADGSRDPNGRLRWRRVSPADRTEGGFTRAADNFDPPLQIRFLNLRLPGIERTSGFFYSLTEVQLYTEGYVAEAPLTSDIVRLPGPRNFGAIRWDPGPDAVPEGAEAEVRTRTGDLLVQEIRYFNKDGIQMKTKEDWDKLITSWKGPIDTTFALGSGWSPWSQKYLQPGDRVTSPGLRNFMQIQTRFTSRDRFKAAEIKSIEIDLVPPVARALVGEIWPGETLPGQVDTFEVFLRPTFISGPATFRTPGFDEILLQAPPGVDLHLLDLSTGTEEELAQEQPLQVFTPTADGTLTDEAGNVVQILSDADDSLWVSLPQLHGNLSADLAAPVYNRITPQGAEVVVGEDGDPVTEVAYALLPEADRGSILYFRKVENAAGSASVEEVAGRTAWEELPLEEQGPIRYFRKLRGGGAQSPFDALGDSLTQASYNALPREERGMVLADGRLVRLRFAATVFLNGTTLKAFVRRSAAGEGLWQQVDPGNATALTESRDLSIRVPLGGKVLDDLALAPNPFTPNGDGINDELEISFSVFQVTSARQARLRIYALNGELMWEGVAATVGGPQKMRWNGLDAHGHVVPPGLYICQIHLGADAEEARGKTLARLVAVAY